MRPRRFVYVIQSDRRPERHYVGVTADVEHRLAAHNAGESPHTRQHGPWRLVACIAFASEARALDFEKYLKSSAGAAFILRHLL